LAVMALSVSVAAQEGERETRIGEEGFKSPPATLDQMDWLVGQWEGKGIRGAPAMESWLKPMGGMMVGTFVQEDADGAIMFTEHMYLVQEDGSLALKLKHFNADLTGWEEKDDFLTFRLVAIEPCVAYFNALTLRCADKEKPGEGLVAAVRMKSGGELVFRFSAMAPEAKLRDADCEDTTTRGYEECFAARGQAFSDRHATYLAAAKARYAQEPEILEAIERSESAFEAYSDAECGAVYDSFGWGSVRNAEWILCTNDLLQRRTHTIWRNWLTFADSTPALLPEPSVTP